MPDLADPNFKRTVVLLVHHDADGSFGLVLNRPTEIASDELCETLGIGWNGDPDLAVHWGGPVQPNTGWVLAGDGVLDGVSEAKQVRDGVHWAGSLEALRLVADEPPARVRLFLGYSGWGPGQLEEEIARGAWVVAPLELELPFEVDSDRMWDQVWRQLGINPATVVSTPGVH